MSGQFKPAPSDNLVWAILCTVLCCLPLGLVGIIKASNVDSLWVQGREEEAIKAANDAKKYSIIGIIVGGGLNLIISIAYIIIAVVSIM